MAFYDRMKVEMAQLRTDLGIVRAALDTHLQEYQHLYMTVMELYDQSMVVGKEIF